MNGDFLLDTNVIIRLFRNDAAVKQQLAGARRVCLSCVVVAELMYGARNLGRVAQNLVKIQELIDANPLLDCDLQTADVFSHVKSELRKSGAMIPENDIWIAAHALQHQLTVVTDDRHFQAVSGLSIENW